MATNSNRRGRPPKGEHEKKAEYLDVRLDTAEKEAFKQAAEVAGVPLSVWVRERLRSAARRELIEVGRQIPFLVAKRG